MRPFRSSSISTAHSIQIEQNPHQHHRPIPTNTNTNTTTSPPPLLPPPFTTSTTTPRRARLNPQRYKGLRDFLRRTRKRTSSRYSTIVIVTLTITIIIWYSLSRKRSSSPTVWISSRTRWPFFRTTDHLNELENLTRQKLDAKPRFTLLVAPHPNRPSPINLPSILTHLRRQTAYDQLYSITVVCSLTWPCPTNVPTDRIVEHVLSLNSFYPPVQSRAVLVIEGLDGLDTMDINWLSNSIKVLLLLPSSNSGTRAEDLMMISSSGLVRSDRTNPRLECISPNRMITKVEIGLTPILMSSRPWKRFDDLIEEDFLGSSGLPSLRLGIDRTLNQFSGFVLPSLDPSKAWKRCESGLGELRGLGNGIENEIVKYLDESLYFDDDQAEEEGRSDEKLCVMLEELNELTSLDDDQNGWSGMICKFLEKGYKLEILVIVRGLNPNSEEKRRRIDLIRCIVEVEVWSTNADVIDGNVIEAQSKWITLFGTRRYSVVLFRRGSMDPIVRDVLEKTFSTDFGQPDHDHWNEGRRMVGIGLPVESIKSSADWITGLEISALRNWHKPRIDITVITNDRPQSLERLLNSLTKANYYGDRVNLILNLEQTADLQTRDLTRDYRWSHGSKTVRQRIIHAGLLPAVVEAWYPSSLHDSYGIFLEDDTEVSAQFYGWLKFALLTYRYSSSSSSNSSRSINGISLYQPQHIELKPEGRRPFNATDLHSRLGLEPITSPYLSQVPCSWGAMFFPESWAGFQHFLTLRLADVLHPLKLEDSAIIGSIRSTRWPKSWKKYYIEWVYLRGEMMVYPNFHTIDRFSRSGGDEIIQPQSLSTNHLEQGTHIHQVVKVESQVRKMFEIPLMDENRSLLIGIGKLGRLPSPDSMMTVDLWGEVSSLEEVRQRGWIAARVLKICGWGKVERFRLNELICDRDP